MTDRAIKYTRAVYEAFELSLRWLTVCTAPDGSVKRYGPFESRNEAENYGHERFDYDVSVVEMHDLDTFEQRMGLELRKTHDHIEDKRAMKNG